jgi:PAN-like domain
MKYCPLALLALALPWVLAAPGNAPNVVRQASPTTTSSTAFATPSPFVCGVQGFASGAFYVTSGSIVTYDECRQFCISTTTCKSFAVLTTGDSKGCAFYGSQV